MKSRTLAIGLGVALLAGCRALSESAEKETVEIEFHTDPMGADVWVEGELVGHTPLNARYEWTKSTAKRTVEFRLPGYMTEKRSFTPITAVIAIRLQEEVGVYVRRVESEPSGATVEIDDRPAGTTPTEIRYSGTAKSVRVVLPGYRSETVPLDMNQSGPLKVRLSRLLPRLP